MRRVSNPLPPKLSWVEKQEKCDKPKKTGIIQLAIL
jgi:hypothetical protein